MPAKVFDFKEKEKYVFNDEKVNVDNEGVKVRKVGDDGIWSMNGLYSEAEVVFPNFKASGMEKIRGFDAEICSLPDGTAVGFQLSNDDGAHWKHWNGTAWIDGVDFSPREDVEENIEDFPLTALRQVKIKCKVSPNAKKTEIPLLQRVTLYYEANYMFVEDMKRSIKRWLDSKFRPEFDVAQILKIAQTDVWVNTDFKVDTVLAVYNLTTDANRTTNLKGTVTNVQTGVDKDGYPIIKTKVTMIASQDAGSVIEIQFKGKCEVYVVQADEDTVASRIPAVVVRIPRVVKADAMKTFDNVLERNKNTMTVVENEPLKWFDVSVTIACMATLDEATIIMADFINDLFDTKNCDLVSLATQEPISVIDVSPYSDANVVSAGLAVKEVDMTLNAPYWEGVEIIKDLAREMIVRVELMNS